MKKIDNFFKLLYFSPKNRIVQPKVVKEDVANIIIIGMMMIGDTIMMLPALTVLRRNFPNAKISIVCGNHVKVILENQNLVDNFFITESPWQAKKKSFNLIFNFISGIFNLNKIHYDLAIDFRGDWRNIFFMNFIKSKRKVSFNYSGGEYMLTDIIEPNPEIESYSDEWLYFLNQLGCDIYDYEKKPVLHLNQKDLAYRDDFSKANDLKDYVIIGLHPGASQRIKEWDVKKYAELILRVSSTAGKFKFLIFEGPGERNTVMQLEEILGNNEVNYLVINKKLNEYVLLISICSIVICNDSSAAHIAGAFSVPTVEIFGNVDPRFVTPKGARILRIVSHNLECKPCHKSFCKLGTSACIKEIEVQEVYQPVLEILSEINNVTYVV
ncbi:glycosyltransferase family 9 protein [Pedobacter sp. N23S346]|uniref:glycosyltransferase family 9 protein n=1 Tax=Pedobacter sp. N23S346 TaxID=3402750 RepID=UPI003ABFE9C6